MSRYRFALGRLVALALLAVVPAIALASDSKTTAAPKGLAADATVNHDYFLAASNLAELGTVNGDVYLAGSTVTIDGTVNGNVYVIGNDVTVNGHINGSVHALAATVTIHGSISHNLYASGGLILLAKGSSVAENSYLAGSTLTIDGDTAGFLKAAGARVSLGGSIGGYADVAPGELALGATAKVGGSLHYWSNNALIATPGVRVGGDTTRYDPPQAPLSSQELRQTSLILSLIWLSGTVVAATVLIKLFPRIALATTHELGHGTSRSALTGLGFLILAPIAGLLLLLSVLGLPLGILFIGLYLLMLFVGPIIAAIWFGQRLAHSLGQAIGPIVATIGGLLALWVLGIIPIIGAILSFYALCTGTGALIRCWWLSRQFHLANPPVEVAPK